MGVHSPAPVPLHSPTLAHGLVVEAKWTAPLFYDLAHRRMCPWLPEHLDHGAGPGSSVKFLGVVWTGKTKVLSQQGLVRSRPTHGPSHPSICKSFGGCWVTGVFLLRLAQTVRPLYALT